MRYALELVNFPDVGDRRQGVRFAEAAEGAGWDGLFMWSVGRAGPRQVV